MPEARSEQKQIAIVSDVLPPSPSGQARVLGNLLAGNDSCGCILLSGGVVSSEYRNPTCFGKVIKLSAPRFEVPESLCPLDARFSITPAVLFDVCRRASEIQEVFKSHDVGLVVACTGNPFDVPASALAAIGARVPFAVYIFDDPVFQWPPGEYRMIAEWLEPIWVRHVAGVITPNDFMAKEFERRSGIRPRVIANAVDTAIYSRKATRLPRSDGRIRIVYTGSIYHAQADAFRNLLRVTDGDSTYEVHIYTSQSESVLRENGIVGKAVVRHPHVDYDAVHKVQESADILFLPLAFESEIQEVLKTSAPAKLGEYLAAGRPILAHAPFDSFVCQYLQQHRAGIVVGRSDPTELKAGLQLIKSNPQLVQELTENAVKLSSEYDIKYARHQFWLFVQDLLSAKQGPAQ